LVHESISPYWVLVGLGAAVLLGAAVVVGVGGIPQLTSMQYELPTLIPLQSDFTLGFCVG
jgi:hypothetical protein